MVRMRWLGAGAAALTVAAASVTLAARPDPVAPQALRDATAAVADATRRAAALDARAQAAADPLDRARLQQAAVAARVDVAAAEVTAGQVRIAMLDGLLTKQRARLAADQGPLVRLVGALIGFARRPALLAAARPASIDDIVHTQAMLAATMPAIRARTAAMAAQVGQTRALRTSAATAAAALTEDRARLVAARAALATLDGADSDQALALGEQARDIVDHLGRVGDGQTVMADLMRLNVPPASDATPVAAAAPVYRLPAAGALTTGFGELSDDGARARGMTIAARPGAAVVVPAAGTVRYARPFRSYGRIVIIDHGDGWTTLLTGLDRLDLAEGRHVAAGAPAGTAGAAGVTVELRRHGRPMDVAALTG